MRAEHVADAEHGRPGGQRHLDRFDRIGRLAGLRHGDRQRARIEHAVAVTKLAGQFHLDGQLAQRAQQIHADHAGVERRAAARDRNLGHRAQQALIDLDLGGELRIARLVDASGKRFLHDVGLDEHFLQHEMLEAVLLCRTRVPHHLGDLALDRNAVEVGQVIARRFDDDHLVFAQDHLLARIFQNRGRIGGHEHLALADAHHERARAAARKHQALGRFRGEHAEREGAAHVA